MAWHKFVFLSCLQDDQKKYGLILNSRRAVVGGGYVVV